MSKVGCTTLGDFELLEFIAELKLEPSESVNSFIFYYHFEIKLITY